MLPERVRKRIEDVKIIEGKCGYSLCGRQYGCHSGFIKSHCGYVVILDKVCDMDSLLP